jgi:hypothetical protein
MNEQLAVSNRSIMSGGSRRRMETIARYFTTVEAAAYTDSSPGALGRAESAGELRSFFTKEGIKLYSVDGLDSWIALKAVAAAVGGTP